MMSKPEDTQKSEASAAAAPAKEKTPYEELSELEKQYIDVSQQVELGQKKQLEYLQAMMPRQIAIMTGVIKTLREENDALKKKLESSKQEA